MTLLQRQNGFIRTMDPTPIGLNFSTDFYMIKRVTAIVQKGIDGIVIPKVNNIGELKKIQKILSGLEKSKKTNI